MVPGYRPGGMGSLVRQKLAGERKVRRQPAQWKLTLPLEYIAVVEPGAQHFDEDLVCDAAATQVP